MRTSLFLRPDTIRNFVFGIEDSLVSTIGFVSGIAAAGFSQKTILLSGAVLILVEAFSMAIGSLLSDNSVEEALEHKEVSYMSSVWGAFVMLVSYVVAGGIIILPYVLVPFAYAFETAISIAVVALFFLGMLSVKVVGVSMWHKGLSTVLLGGLAIVIGVGVGLLFR